MVPNHLRTLKILMVVGLQVLALLVASRGFADSWQPWPNQRIPSANGKYYVVMKRTGGPVVYGEWGPIEFEIAEIAPGSSPVISVVSRVVELSRREFNSGDGNPYRMGSNSGIAVRSGDRVLGRGKLDRPPLRVIVSSNGLGFVGLDVWGYNYAYYNEGLKQAAGATLVGSSGKVLHTIALADLYSADELKGFETTAGGLDWVRGQIPGWIDEAKKRVVIVGSLSDRHPDRYLIRFIDWETGKRSVGTTLESQEEVARFHNESAKDSP